MVKNIEKLKKFEAIQRKIIEITIDLIAERSITSVSTRDISRKAGIDRSLLYYYFENKEDLMYQTLLYINEALYVEINKLDLNKFDTDEAKFKNMLRCIYDYFCKNISHVSALRQLTVIGHLLLSEKAKDDAVFIVEHNHPLIIFLKSLEPRNKKVRELGIASVLFCYMPLCDIIMHTYFPKTVTDKQVELFIDSLWDSIKEYD
jgi:AcrR family transcriptional regulator